MSQLITMDNPLNQLSYSSGAISKKIDLLSQNRNQNKKESFATILQDESKFDDIDSGSKIHSSTKHKFQEEENQLYQQQMLLMPLLQFSMQQTTTAQNIMQSKPETNDVLISLSNAAGSFIPENRFEETEGLVLNSLDEATNVSSFLENDLRNPTGHEVIPTNPNIITSNGISDFMLPIEQIEISQMGGSPPSSNTNEVLGQFGQQVENPDVIGEVVSQAFYESGIASEELDNDVLISLPNRNQNKDVSLALFLRSTEENVVISRKPKASVSEANRKTKSSVNEVNIAGIDTEKTRQLFSSAAPMLQQELRTPHNRLEQIVAYNSLDKPEPASNDVLISLTNRNQNKSGVNANLNSLENNGLGWLMPSQFEDFYFGQQAVQNGQPDLSDVSPTDVITQIGNEIQMNFNTELKELKVQLKPEHLGSVTLKVSMIDDVLFVDISTENAAVKSIVESHIHDLKQTLSLQGIEVGRLNVSAEGNMSGSGSQSGMFSSHAQNFRGRRNLQLLDEVWEQEDWLARQTVIDLWM